MDKKIILSVLIVALIGIVAATYQINVGNDLLNPLANVQPEEETPVTEALSAPAASTSGDSANAPESNQQSNAQAQQQAQQQAQSTQAQQQAQSTQAQQQSTNNNQGSSSTSQSSSSNNQGSSSSSQSSSSTNSSSGSNTNNNVVTSVSGARQYAIARMQDSGMTLGDGYRDTDRNGNLVYVFPVYNYNNKNIGNMYIYPDGEMQAPDVSRDVISSLSEARSHANDHINPRETVLGDGYETSDVNGDLVYKFPLYDHNEKYKGDMYIYPDGEVQAPDVSYQN